MINQLFIVLIINMILISAISIKVKTFNNNDKENKDPNTLNQNHNQANSINYLGLRRLEPKRSYFSDLNLLNQNPNLDRLNSLDITRLETRPFHTYYPNNDMKDQANLFTEIRNTELARDLPS